VIDKKVIKSARAKMAFLTFRKNTKAYLWKAWRKQERVM
jgi:hypothetical protein